MVGVFLNGENALVYFCLCLLFHKHSYNFPLFLQLIRFLKSILNIKNDHQDESHYFNPKAAVFVCNRWDLIDDKDKAKVKENALHKLRGVWPKLEDKQVCFSSSKSPDSDQLNTLLQCLDGVFQLAKEVDITNSYW